MKYLGENMDRDDLKGSKAMYQNSHFLSELKRDEEEKTFKSKKHKMKAMRERDELLRRLTTEMQATKSQELAKKSADVKLDKRDIDKRILYLARVKSQYNEMQSMSGLSNSLPNSQPSRDGTTSTAPPPHMQKTRTATSKWEKQETNLNKNWMDSGDDPIDEDEDDS